MKKCSLVVLAVLVCAGVGFAQTQTGQIFGTVTDTSGAVMPNVKVTLSGPAILQPIVINTSDAGSYTFPNIPIGTYSVKFEAASGYRASLRENIRVDIGFNAQVNAQLAIASVEQSIEVSGSAPVIDTQSTAQSAELDQTTLNELPVARSFFNSVELTPGVTEAAKDVGGAQNLNQPGFISRGANNGQNRYFYDGADIAPAAGGNAMWIDYNSVQEMQVTSGGADASVQTSGMSINMVTKSGSDVFHGSFHDFEEGQSFESSNIDDSAFRASIAQAGSSTGNPLTHFRDIGGDIGGPIKKGKLWFWSDYGDNGVWVGYDKVYPTTPNAPDCTAVAANQLAYSWSKVRSCFLEDPTFIKAFVWKIGWTPFHNNTFTFTNEYSVKQVRDNGLTTLVPLISTRPQNSACGNHFQWGGIKDISPVKQAFLWSCGWPTLFKFDDQQIMSNRWVLDVAFMHFSKRNQFALHDDLNPNIYNTQEALEQSTGAIDRSNQYVTTFQPMNNFQITSIYTLPGFLGGNHSIKVGYNWIRFENCCLTIQPTGVEAIFSSGTAAPFSKAFRATFFRGGQIDAFLREQNVYFQDTYTHKRMTLNLGIRWDHQTDSEMGQNVAANPFEGMTTQSGGTFTYLPAVNWAGSDGGVAWNTFAPRLGITYDLFGKGKTVIKSNFAMYFDQRSAGQLADVHNPIGNGTAPLSVSFPWTDLNKDGLVQINEVDTSKAPAAFSTNYQVASPGATTTPNTVDPNIRDPKTMEASVGVSQQVGAGFGVSVTYIWRRYTDFIFKRLNGITSADYFPCTTVPGGTTSCSGPGVPAGSFPQVTETCPTTVAPAAPTQCAPVTFYTPDILTPSIYTLTNQPDYHVTYQGLEIVARKTLMKNWFINGSFSIQSTRQYWTASDAYQDPTNIATQNGAQFAPGLSAGGGFPVNIPVNARWNGKVGGLYRLPWWGIELAASDDFTQGYPILSAINISNRFNSAGSITALVAPPGTQRYKAVQNAALRVDKTFTFRERWRVNPSLDIYNLFNSNPILGQQPNQNASNANSIFYVLSPRVLRLGIVVSF